MELLRVYESLPVAAHRAGRVDHARTDVGITLAFISPSARGGVLKRRAAELRCAATVVVSSRVQRIIDPGAPPG